MRKDTRKTVTGKTEEEFERMKWDFMEYFIARENKTHEDGSRGEKTGNVFYFRTSCEPNSVVDRTHEKHCVEDLLIRLGCCLLLSFAILCCPLVSFGVLWCPVRVVNLIKRLPRLE